MREERAAEPTWIKVPYPDEPEEVDEWANAEIEKLDLMGVKKLLKDATAGI